MRDRPLRRGSAGRHLRGRRLRRGPALLRLLADLSWGHRFADAADQLDLVDHLEAFLAPLEIYELELSPDLRDLDGLARFLA